MKMRFIILMFFLLCLGASACTGDFQKGSDAHRKGDYATAFEGFRLAAEQGDAEAQHILGNQYRDGEGVRQDKKQAAKWYRLAAEQGYVKAQNNLGLLYLLGQGVRQNIVSAQMWFTLAARNSNEDTTINIRISVKGMTRAQIKKAQTRAQKCIKKNYKGC